MLTILSVNPTGFASYGQEITHQLRDRGLIKLVGLNKDKYDSSNGSGKTSLFNVVTLCLFRKVETFLEGTISGGDEFANETLGLGMCPRTEWVNSKGEHWRNTVSRKWKGTCPYENDSPLYPFDKTDVYLERLVDGVWVDERAAESVKTWNKVREAVGISYERFLVTTYLSQNKGGLGFLRGTHAIKMQIFTDAINLGVWDTISADFKSERDLAEKSLQRAESKLSETKAKRSAYVVLSLTEVAETELSILLLTQKISKLQDAKLECQDSLESLSQQLGSIQRGTNPYPQQLSSLRLTLANEEKAYRQKSEVLETRGDPKIRLLEQTVAVVKSEMLTAKRTFEDFKSGKLSSCPTCGQKLEINGDHLEAEFFKFDDEYVKQSEELERLKKLHSDQVADEQNQLTSAFELTSKELTVRINDTSRFSQDFVASEFGVNTAFKELTDSRERVRKEASGVDDQIRSSEQEKNSLQSRLETSQKNQALVDVLDAEISSIETTVESIRQEYLEWAWLVKNAGDKGFKSWKLLAATERLNTLLAESLADLDGAFNVYCQPYRVKAGSESKVTLTTDDVINEFTIYIKEGAKKDTPAYMYSGGEISLVAIPFLVAFWRLTDENGHGTNLLLLDEIAGAFDDRNSQIVTSFIEGLNQKGKTVLLISHNSLIDQTSFDATWTVTKEHGISTLAEGLE